MSNSENSSLIRKLQADNSGYRQLQRQSAYVLKEKPRLAYVSPLPPEKTGIADYSAELIPELAKYYDITVIVDQKEFSDWWINLYCSLRSPQWLLENVSQIDRVLYHFGNSSFHTHMFPLIEEIPGVVVLHDFFLSGVQYHRDMHELPPFSGTKDLFISHGYKAVHERFHTADIAEVVWKYPASYNVIRNAYGVIAHSEYSKTLAKEWFGEECANAFEVIPLLRVFCEKKEKEAARKALGISEDIFLVCSFGFLGRTKLNHRLLAAWFQSNLCSDSRAILIFVGELHCGEYQEYISSLINQAGHKEGVRITGWASTETFRRYLAAADVAVQLRTRSRGETSAAVLDCMNYGVPTIVNANGSVAELNSEAVLLLPDLFSDEELAHALETLRFDQGLQERLSIRAQREIAEKHSPSNCAARYAEVIEQFYGRAGTSCKMEYCCSEGDERTTASFSQKRGKIISPTGIPGQLLIDITATFRNDLKTGIERVARSLVLALLNSPPQGYRVEPVYLTDEGGRWHYRYARGYTMCLLECPPDILTDDAAAFQNGDILLCVDLSGSLLVNAYREGLFLEMKKQGVRLFSMLFDILPLTMPHYFPEGADKMHLEWLNVVLEMHGSICISKAVADELGSWIAQHVPSKSTSFQIEWSHLGADVDTSAPSTGLLHDAEDVLSRITQVTSFLMVGTIEPRKGYLQTIQAFSELWESGENFNLVIVGKEGWKDLPQEMRRTIPEIIQRLGNHPQRGKRLFWLEGISDEYLEKVYEASTCLIFASEGEGFGLPLIEAAKHGLPIIARDIPVFREVAGEHACYFSGTHANDLSEAIKQWLELYNRNAHPKSDAMPRLTWKESAERVQKLLMECKKNCLNVF